MMMAQTGVERIVFTAGTWLETVGGEFPSGHYQQ